MTDSNDASDVWILKYDDERTTRRWTAIGGGGRLGDVETAEEAIDLLRRAGAPRHLQFMDIRFEQSTSSDV